MLAIDRTLLAKLEEAKSYFEEVYGAIDSAKYHEKDASVRGDVGLEITTFQSIIAECKEEVASNTIEEIVQILEVVYHLSLQKGTVEPIRQKLTQIDEKFLHLRRDEVTIDEERLRRYREDIVLLDSIVEAIGVRRKALEAKKEWLFFRDTALLEQYEMYAKSFAQHVERVTILFSFHSALLGNYIVESFHYLYLFFSYAISYFIATGNALVLVEIAASIDRYVEVMRPLRKSGALKREYLRNSYVMQELGLLREQILRFAA
ncbi:MAG: hypothetical protein KU37_03555 [Sulfuricurvum sp. PC08-66]|nr:MAG: hypothetical protein KU37_03555 [Sulfuricurvum sp. PC08-66]